MCRTPIAGTVRVVGVRRQLKVGAKAFYTHRPGWGSTGGLTGQVQQVRRSGGNPRQRKL